MDANSEWEARAPTQLESQTKLKNSSEATHSVLFDTMTRVKEETAIKITSKLQASKTRR